MAVSALCANDIEINILKTPFGVSFYCLPPVLKMAVIRNMSYLCVNVHL